MVIRLGFEPKTHSLEGCCSIQLSYQTITSLLGNDAAKIRLFFNLWVFQGEKKFISHLDFLCRRDVRMTWTFVFDLLHRLGSHLGLRT